MKVIKKYKAGEKIPDGAKFLHSSEGSEVMELEGGKKIRTAITYFHYEVEEEKQLHKEIKIDMRK